MDEVDSILIYTLKQIGCDVGTSIGELSPTQIITCVSRCCELARPDLQIPSYDGSTSMSARYKVASQISQAITDLGYKDEIGCQTFLYPTENDTRKLLIFLMEKLPKDVDSGIGNNIETLLSRFTIKNDNQNNNNELGVSSKAEPEVSGIRLPTAVDVDSLPKETLRFYASHLADLTFAREKAKFKAPSSQNQTTPPKLPPVVSKVEEDDFGDPDEQLEPEPIVVIKEVAPVIEKPKVKEKPKIVEKPKPKPPLKEKPKLVTSRSTENEQKRLDDERLASEVAQKIKSMQDEITERSLEVRSKDSLTMTLDKSILLSQDEIERLKAELQQREKEVDRKRKTAQLLENSENGLEKVQKAIEVQVEKIRNLSKRWEDHRKPLVDEIHRKNDDGLFAVQKEEIRKLKFKLKEMGIEARSKAEVSEGLQTEYEKMTKDVNRSAYTKRITEIIGNIKKQKKEITKVLMDTKEIQKEINSLSGKLGRTFAVADELIFKDAEKDKNVAQSYKLLVAIHSDFSRIIRILEDVGNFKRHYRDLEDKIELERSKSSEAKLERLRADLGQMKHENQILQAKLRDPAFQKNHVDNSDDDE